MSNTLTSEDAKLPGTTDGAESIAETTVRGGASLIETDLRVGVAPMAESVPRNIVDAIGVPGVPFRLFSESTFLNCFVLAIWGLIAYYYGTFFIFSAMCPYSLDYEGHVVWACNQLAHLRNIYDPAMLNQQPFAITMYNPLFMVVGALAFQITGLDIGILRCISISATIVCFFGFYNLLRHRCKTDQFSALMGTAIFATYLSPVYWSHIARVDMLGLAFAIWGVERFLLAIELSKSSTDAPLSEEASFWQFRPTIVISMVLFLAAFFTKQQYFIFPVATAFYCIWQGRRSLGIKMLASFLGFSLLIGGLIQLVTGGYLAHLTYASGLQWEWETLSQSLVPFLSDNKTVAIGVLLIAAFFVRAPGAPFDRVAISIVAISLPLALYTMGLRGAYHNHLLCLEFALCWLLATSIRRFSPKITLFMLILTSLSLITIVDHLEDFHWRIEHMYPNPLTSRRLVTLKLKDKPVLFEDAYVAMVMRAKPDFVDVTTLLNTARGASDKIKIMCASVEQKKYAAIMINMLDDQISREAIWPANVVRCIKQNYRIIGEFCSNGERQVVYAPKSQK